MISSLILAAALSGCPGGVCAAPAKILHRERHVVVNREVQPVRKVASRVRHRHVLRFWRW